MLIRKRSNLPRDFENLPTVSQAARLDDQEAALKLAICDDIGEAAYDNQRVAAALVDRLQAAAACLEKRYSLPLGELTGESYVEALARERYQDDRERAARTLLNDFRKGTLGPICLEWPPQ